MQAVYDYFKNDDAKDDNGNWLDDYDHRTYCEILGTTADELYKHLVPVRQPEILEENLPIVSFHTSIRQSRFGPYFKEITLDLDIYTEDNTLEENLKISKRHFQLLESKILSVNLPYLGKWHLIAEMPLVLMNPDLFCYSQRFITILKREFLVTKRKR